MQLVVDADPDADVVEGDERRILQVIFNLVSNAVKFTPRAGRSSSAWRAFPDEVLVSVADTGPGIAPEDQERIFEEFEQDESQARVDDEGTGLGLPLSRRLIELHRGRLWVESQPGRGATFRFVLPEGDSGRRWCRRPLRRPVRSRTGIRVRRAAVIRISGTAAGRPGS